MCTNNLVYSIRVVELNTFNKLKNNGVLLNWVFVKLGSINLTT